MIARLRCETKLWLPITLWKREFYAVLNLILAVKSISADVAAFAGQHSAKYSTMALCRSPSADDLALRAKLELSCRIS